MQKQQRPFVVGIGGSAGSLSAIKRFLTALSQADGMALIIQPHTNAAPLASAADIFRSSTPLNVVDASDGGTVTPGCVYVAPAENAVQLQGGRLRVTPWKKSSSRLRPIDMLFRSIAKSAGPHSAGILFAGDDTEGVLGLEDLVNSGVVTFVQNPPTTDHPNMPETAIAFHTVDVIGSPERLAEELLAHAGRQAETQGLVKPAEIQSHDLSEICRLLKKATGQDFRHYKTSTLTRRILRRIHIAGAKSTDDYLMTLKGNPEEGTLLMRDLLIGVTSFFRDASAFEALSQLVLKPLVATGAPIRIWAPGCGTGQEADTIAMLVTEALDGLDIKPDVQIFATDLDERALNYARRGTYPRSIANEVTPHRLERFFTSQGHRFQIKKDLRKLLVFSPHNLISDPPFSPLDLISCRNLLIYLGPHLQKKLMSVFHYSLAENGYLFLGSSESVSGHSELFRIADAKHRIAQRKPTRVDRLRLPRQTGVPAGFDCSRPHQAEEVDIGALSQRMLLDEFSPPYAVVNQDAQIVYLSQKIGAFLQPPEGDYANNIFRMARSGLRVGLRSAWNEALEMKRKAIYEGLSVEFEGEPHQIRLTVQPMPDLGQASGLNMVVFQIMGPGLPSQGTAQSHSPEEAERLIAQLEAELLRTRNELERAVQDLEAANEELKSSNEELLSMNEELQSSNEELESSKDEVEAANAALAGANADLQNLLHSTELATIFIDASGCLRRYTPAATALYNLLPSDIGRSITHITHVFDDLTLPSLAEVLEAGTRLEREVRDQNGRTFLQRVTPYRTTDGDPDGTVITFLDITEQKEIQQRLKMAEQEAEARLAELESVYANAPVGLALLDRQFRYVRVNNTLAAMNGIDAAAHLGKTVQEVVPDLVEDLVPMLQQVLETGETIGPREVTGETAKEPGARRTWLETWGPVVGPSGEVIGVQGSAKDITDRKRALEDLRESRGRLAMALRAGQLGVHDYDLRTGRVQWDARVYQLWGVPEGQAVNYELFEAGVHPDDRTAVKAAIAAAIDPGGDQHFECEYRVINGADGETRWVFADGEVLFDDNEPVRLVGTVQDVTERRRVEAALRLSETRLRFCLKASSAGVWEWDIVSGVTSWSEDNYTLFDLDPKAGPPSYDEWTALIHPHDRAAAQAAVQKALDGSEYIAEFRVPRRDGTSSWILSVGRAEYNADGRPVRMSGLNLDITQQKRAGEALRESEERFRGVFQHAAIGISIANLDGQFISCNPAYASMVGHSLDKLRGLKIADVVHPDDRNENLGQIERLLGQEISSFEIVNRYLAQNGANTWVHKHVSLLRDAFGDPVNIISLVTDISERKRQDEQIQTLMHELNHRSKNILTTVQAIARQTTMSTPQDFIKRFEERIRALAASQDLLVNNNWKGTPLDALIVSQLAHFKDLIGTRIELEGPKLCVSAAAAQVLGMALHELGTNAGKYGALSNQTGRVKISWQALQAETGTETFTMSWEESGGPEVAAPVRRGFGSKVLGAMVERGLDAEVQYCYAGEGVSWRLRAQLREVAERIKS